MKEKNSACEILSSLGLCKTILLVCAIDMIGI